MEQAKRRSIIDLSCVEARVFLLKQESYCNFDLPPYFQFDELLNGIIEEIRDKPLSSFGNSRSSRNLEDVNYRILNNKDGKYAWRPLELIHPALYVSVVNKITEQDHWERIRNRCSYFRSNPKVKCLSLPVESLTNAKDKAEQISQWWEDVEQKSIELSLDYEFIIHTDIADCYPRIYTHSMGIIYLSDQRESLPLSMIPPILCLFRRCIENRVENFIRRCLDSLGHRFSRAAYLSCLFGHLSPSYVLSLLNPNSES